MAPTLQTIRARLTGATLLAALSTGSAQAAPEDFVIDPNHTYATFEIRHLGISTQRGRFNRTTGKATLDAATGTGSLDIMIDARTIDTGSEAMEKFLRGQDFFNVDKFADITFHSQTVTYAQGKPTRIDGNLTLLGVTKPVALQVTWYACTRLPFLVRVTCGMDAVTTIQRSDFGMSSLLSFVGDEVKLLVQAEAIRQEPPPPQQEGGG